MVLASSNSLYSLKIYIDKIKNTLLSQLPKSRGQNNSMKLSKYLLKLIPVETIILVPVYNRYHWALFTVKG